MASPDLAPLSSDAFQALRQELEHFGSRVKMRGEHYARHGRVGAVNFGSREFTAPVRGSSGSYRAGWFRDGRFWFPECTCPVGPQCKHAYALALVVLGKRPVGAAADDFKREPRREDGEDTSHAALRNLRSSARAWEREHSLAQLLARAPTTLSAYVQPFPDILTEPDAEILNWRLAQEIARQAGGWLPAALEPYRHRPDLEYSLEDRARGELARELRAWVRQRQRTSQRQLRLLLRLRDDPGGHPSVEIETRLSSPRVEDAPRTPQQLAQLRNEVRNGSAAMPPAQVHLLEWLVESGTSSANQGPTLPHARLQALFHVLPSSPLITWADEQPSSLAARAGITPGEAVGFRADGVRLLPMLVARDGESVLELRLLWPDGKQSSLDEVVYLRSHDAWSPIPQPSFIVRDGTFWAVADEPPRALVERFAQARYLPVAAAERAETVGLLSSTFPHVREGLEPHVRRYDAAPAIAMDLRNDDWMQLRLFAHTGGADWSPTAAPSGVVAFEYDYGRRWSRLRQPQPSSEPANAPAPKRAVATAEDETHFDVMSAGAAGSTTTAGADTETVWIEEPDPERVESAIAWLEETCATVGGKGNGPAWPDRDTGWWVFLNRKRLSRLAEAWEDRPAGIGFFGTPRIRRLFTGRDTVRARVHVNASGVDWLSVSAEWEAEGRRLTDDELAQLRASNSRFVKLPSGWVRREIADDHDETAQLLADVGIEVGQGEQKIELLQVASARAESLEALERLGADPAAIEAVRRLRARVAEFAGLAEIAPPPGLTADLRPYQRRGLDFLAHCAALGTGAILADDMGLGKTVQALAWLLHLRREEPGSGPSLVVCPASVVHNWAREAERFTPGLRVLLLTSGKQRHELRRSIGDYDVVVTNYALLRRDIEAWRTIDLHAAILDEAQGIKNPDAAVTRAARELRARHRLALTGTPMENRALDLWSILSFTNPGYLGNRVNFSARYDRGAAPHVRALLGARLRPLLLRRTKLEVAPELPDRIEERVDCEMTRGQRQLYLAELRRSRRLLDEIGREPDGLRKNRITILAALTRLRQICCHPALVGGRDSLGSGKFDTLFEQLEPLLAEGHKVLVFSQFVECLKLLAAEMRERGMPFHMLTGQTVKRERVVDAFESDSRASVFLISLKAGGTGLNLTAASYVVVFDPWWNPAVEAQAIDRTHRIGQTRTVIAYRLLTRGTIEEKTFDLQQRKAELVRDVLGESGFARALTRSDLEYLLTADDEE